MSGPKRNPDKLNTIGVVVVGICGAVLVYVTIVALQAFYLNNTSEIQTMADYGGQDTLAKGRKADELRNISEAGKNAVIEGREPTYRIPIDVAMKLVVEDAKKDPSHLIPALPPSTKPSIAPVFGRPKPAAPAGEGGSAAPAGGATAEPGAAAAPTGAPGQPGAGTAGAPATQTPPAQPAPGAQPAKGDAKAPAQATTQPKADAKAPAQPTQPKADASKAPAPAQPKNP
jgi:hypothetical protein